MIINLDISIYRIEENDVKGEKWYISKFENTSMMVGRNLVTMEDNIYKNQFDEEKMTKYIEKLTIQESAGVLRWWRVKWSKKLWKGERGEIGDNK